MIATEDIKHALKKYHFNHNKVVKARERINAINDLMTHIPSGINTLPKSKTTVKNSRLLDLIERKDIILHNVQAHVYYLQLAYDFIYWLSSPERQMIVDRYINNMTIDELSNKYHFSNRQIYRYIDQLINDYIQCCHI